MDLKFDKEQFSYLRQIMQDIRYQEETGEVIVPDSYPDIQSIICASAEAIIRGKECRGGWVTISGGVKGVIMYRPEDNSYPRTLDVYLPFTYKIEDSAISEECMVIADVKVRSTDGRILNSRKAMLRADIGCRFAVYESKDEEIFELLQMSETMQMKEESYKIWLPVELAEKSFAFSEHLEFPTNGPSIMRVCRVKNSVEIQEQKIVANKAVFKGEVVCKMLYIADDEGLYTHTQTFPFSQYCELQRDYDQAQVKFSPMITGYDVEMNLSEENGTGLLTINLLVQCVVSVEKSLHLHTDAYSTTEELQLDWKEYRFRCDVDEFEDKQSVRQSIKAEWIEVIDAEVITEYPRVQYEKDQVRVTTPVKIQVLGRNEGGEVALLSERTELVQEYARSDKVRVCTQAKPIEHIHTTLQQSSVDVQCEIQILNVFSCDQEMKTLCGGSAEELDSDVKRASVIVRKVKKDTDLWDLAKEHRSRKDVIRTVNELDADILHEDRMILIPVG